MDSWGVCRFKNNSQDAITAQTCSVNTCDIAGDKEALRTSVHRMYSTAQGRQPPPSTPSHCSSSIFVFLFLYIYMYINVECLHMRSEITQIWVSYLCSRPIYCELGTFCLVPPSPPIWCVKCSIADNHKGTKTQSNKHCHRIAILSGSTMSIFYIDDMKSQLY